MNRKLWLGIAVSGVLLWLSARNVDLVQAWSYMTRINTIYLIPSALLLIVETVLRAAKWQLMLRPLKHCSFGKLNSATLVGLMANNVLPARAGEFVRAYAGARLAGIPYSTSLATVVIDRVLDGLTVSALFIIVIIFQPLPDVITAGGYLAAGIYLVTLVFLIGLIVSTERTLGLANRLLPQISPPPASSSGGIGRWLRSTYIALRTSGLHALTTFVEGLGVFRSAPLLLASSILSALIWIAYGVGIYLMFPMFNLQLSMFQAFVVLLVVTIALTLPAAPGFVGAMEGAIVFSLTQLFGIEDTTLAFALALVYHVLQYIPITVAGILAMWLERLSMAEISHVAPGET